MSCLGSDIWKEIVSYLESEDIVFLLRLCKWMRNILLEAKHSGLDMRYKSLCQLHAKEIIVRENGIKKISHPHDVTSLILLNDPIEVLVHAHAFINVTRIHFGWREKPGLEDLIRQPLLLNAHFYEKLKRDISPRNYVNALVENQKSPRFGKLELLGIVASCFQSSILYGLNYSHLKTFIFSWENEQNDASDSFYTICQVTKAAYQTLETVVLINHNHWGELTAQSFFGTDRTYPVLKNIILYRIKWYESPVGTRFRSVKVLSCSYWPYPEASWFPQVEHLRLHVQNTVIFRASLPTLPYLRKLELLIYKDPGRNIRDGAFDFREYSKLESIDIVLKRPVDMICTEEVLDQDLANLFTALVEFPLPETVAKVRIASEHGTLISEATKNGCLSKLKEKKLQLSVLLECRTEKFFINKQ